MQPGQCRPRRRATRPSGSRRITSYNVCYTKLLRILGGSAPLALTGALLFTFLGFTSLNIYSQVGLITLVGLIAKNGILIVEFANQLQERGVAKAAALREAAETRLRPVLMTSMCTAFGVV